MRFEALAETWVRGGEIEHPPESIRLFGLCQQMKWAHLPVDGGIYDQDPQLLVEWEIIFRFQAEFQKEEAIRQARKQRGTVSAEF